MTKRRAIYHSWRFHIEVLWEPRDLWVGVYWDRRRDSNPFRDYLHIYICVLPTLVLHAIVPVGKTGSGQRGVAR